MAIDPFEAAMAQLGGGGDDKKKGGDDPFENALSALDSDGEDAGSGDPFESAMASLGDDDGGGDDPFAKAMAVANTQQAIDDAKGPVANQGHSIDVEFLMDIKLKMSFEVGRAKMFISDLLSLGQGSVIELHRLVGEELEIFVNGQLLATGEVVVVNEKFGARISRILPPDERVRRLGPYM